MIRSHRLAAVALAAALVVSACGGSDDTESSSATTAPGKVDTSSDITGKGPDGSGPAPDAVTVAVRIDVDSFDPHTSLGDSAAQQAFLFLYDTMVHRTLDGEILPGVASEWEVTPTKGVFTIRDGLTCTDGTPLDATAVAASYESLGNNPGSLGKSKIFGPDGMASVTADPAAKTVTIETKSPNNDMLTGLATTGFIVCPAGLADPASIKEAPAGSGPYELTDSKRGDEYTLQLRDDYAGFFDDTTLEDLPKTVTLKVITDDAAAADLVESGKIQIAGILSTDAKRLLANSDLVSVPAQGYGSNAVLMMQKPSAATSDEKLRQGIAMLLDSVQGAAETQGLGTPAVPSTRRASTATRPMPRPTPPSTTRRLRRPSSTRPVTRSAPTASAPSPTVPSSPSRWSATTPRVRSRSSSPTRSRRATSTSTSSSARTTSRSPSC